MVLMAGLQLATGIDEARTEPSAARQSLQVRLSPSSAQPPQLPV